MVFVECGNSSPWKVLLLVGFILGVGLDLVEMCVMFALLGRYLVYWGMISPLLGKWSKWTENTAYNTECLSL